jgi:hypothetical protein
MTVFVAGRCCAGFLSEHEPPTVQAAARCLFRHLMSTAPDALWLLVRGTPAPPVMPWLPSASGNAAPPG